LWLKRVEKDKFPWLLDKEGVREINIERLQMLLDGIDFFHEHKRLEYREIK